MLSEMMIERIQLEEQEIIQYYRQNSEMVEDLTNLVKSAVSQVSGNISETIYELSTKLGVLIKYDTQEKFDDFMFSEETLTL